MLENGIGGLIEGDLAPETALRDSQW